MRFPRSLRHLPVALLALLALPASAQAADCPPVATTQPYTWAGDAGWYFIAPGGTFQPGATPWSYTGGAGTVADAWRRTGNVVAQAPAGATATSPSICVDAYRPHLRFDVRALGRTGALKVEALRTGRMPVVLGTVGATSAPSWTLSPKVPLATALGVARGTSQAVRLRFSASGTTWRFDDVAIDPYRR